MYITKCLIYGILCDIIKYWKNMIKYLKYFKRLKCMILSYSKYIHLNYKSREFLFLTTDYFKFIFYLTCIKTEMIRTYI